MRRAYAIVLLTLGSSSTISATVSAKGLEKDVMRYAEAHKFPVQAVEAGPAGRRVMRLFVPITRSTWGDFRQRFNDAGGVILHSTTLYYHGAVLSRAPNEALVWGGDGYTWHPEHGQRNMDFRPGSMSFVFKLSPRKMAHMNEWIATKGPEEGRRAPGHSFLWLNAIETAPGRLLFHDLGIRRTVDGPQLRAKLAHAANKRIEVVGVQVDSVEDFHRRASEGTQLGLEPRGGVEHAVHNSGTGATKRSTAPDRSIR